MFSLAHFGFLLYFMANIIDKKRILYKFFFGFRLYIYLKKKEERKMALR